MKGKKVSPNVSDRTIVNAALQDYKNNVQQRLILNKHKISRALLMRYVKRYGIQRGDKTKVHYELFAKGRPNQVKKIVAIMKHEVKIAKQSVKQMLGQHLYTKKATGLLQQSQTNALVPLKKLSKKTWTRAYTASCGSEKVKCSESYAGRAIGILDWRNAIGVGATWNCCVNLRTPVKPCNLWSMDDLGVTVNPLTGRLEVVRITKEERKRLNNLHLNPGAAPDPDKVTEASNVVYKMTNIVNAEGHRGPIVTKLLDHDFKWDDKPDQWLAFYCINPVMHIYAACINRSHPKYCEIEYFEQMFVKIIIPYVVEYRNRNTSTGPVRVSQMHSQDSMSPGLQLAFDFDNGDRIIITMDGYYPGIEAIIRLVGAIMNENGIEVFKWAGGCTLVQQPADVGDNHMEMHRAAAGDTFKYDENGAPTTRCEAFIEALPSMGPNGARLHTHQKFLRHLEWMVDKAWSKHGITEGWRISGMWPVDVSRILSGWGGWEDVPTENAQKIVELCSDLDGDAFHAIVEDKYLDDLKAQNIFGDLIEDEKYKRFMADKEPTAAPTNMRSLMLNTKAFDTDRSFMRALWDKRRVDEARLQAAHGEMVGGVQMCICRLKLPKDIEKHLDTRVHKDRVARAGIADVPAPRPIDVAIPQVAAPVSLQESRHISRLDADSSSPLRSRLLFDAHALEWSQ